MSKIFQITAALLLFSSLAACQSGSGAESASRDTTANNAVICPDELPAVDLDTAPEYDSWLVMKGGAYGHVQREWHNGCAQQLSFPADADNNPPYNEPQADYKPAWSPDGEHITFFRRFYSFTGIAQEQLLVIGDNVIPNWVSAVMVMNSADGSDVRPLTLVDDEYLHVNPMWTRKKYPNKSGGMGYRVTYTRALREADEDEGGLPNVIPRTGTAGPSEVCWADVDGEPGDERCYTDNALGGMFGYSSLKDGRQLVRIEATREFALITPNEEDPSQTKIEVLDYQPGGIMGMPILHKATISMDESKIAYMKVDPELQNAGSATAFGLAVIAIADLDIENLTISNELEITQLNPVNIEWYPSISKNNKQVIWFCSGNCPYWEPTLPINYYTENAQVVEYDMETQVIRRISHELDVNYRYPDIWGTVK